MSIDYDLKSMTYCDNCCNKIKLYDYYYNKDCYGYNLSYEMLSDFCNEECFCSKECYEEYKKKENK